MPIVFGTPILSRLGLTAQELLQQVWKFSLPTDNQSVPPRGPAGVDFYIGTGRCVSRIYFMELSNLSLKVVC